jgi:hypothetical protein
MEDHDTGNGPEMDKGVFYLVGHAKMLGNGKVT